MTAARDAVVTALTRAEPGSGDHIADVAALPFEPGDEPEIAFTFGGADLVLTLAPI